MQVLFHHNFLSPYLPSSHNFLERWIPTLFNTLSFRPLEPKAAIFANSLFQQIIALNVANFHRDLSELMHVLLWLMTYKDNVFYKKYNNLPELKEMEKSPLFPWNVRVFRKNGLKGLLFLFVLILRYPNETHLTIGSLFFSHPQSSLLHNPQSHRRHRQLPYYPCPSCPPRYQSPTTFQVYDYCHRCYLCFSLVSF